MSTSTQPGTFTELFTDLLDRTRTGSSASASVVQAKRYINIGLQDMHIGFGEKFTWAHRNAFLIAHPPYSTGTVTFVQGASAFTGSGTAWDTVNGQTLSKNMLVGGKIVFSSSEVYEINAVTNDGSAGIASIYIGDSLVDASYRYYEDEYALASDFLRPLDHRRFTDGALNIALIGRTDFRRWFGRNHIVGPPANATLIDLAPSGNTTPRRRIVLNPPPDKAYQIPYEYVTSQLAVSSAGTAQTSLSADTDEPIVPLRYRMAIVLHGLYHWYRDRKDDVRSAEARSEYVDLLTRITGDYEIGSQKTRIQPRVGPYRSRARRPWGRGSHGRFDMNGRFDRLEW